MIEENIAKIAKESAERCAVAVIPSDTLDEIPVRAETAKRSDIK